MLIALLVCLIPTTIGALLSAIGIAGMDRLVQRNVLAMSGRAVEAAGDIDTLLMDKTGTITYGNRRATALHPAPGVDRARPGRRRAAVQPGRRHPRGPQHRRTVRAATTPRPAPGASETAGEFVPFTAHTRMSGLDRRRTAIRIRKGAADAVTRWVAAAAARCLDEAVTDDRRRDRPRGGTPLVVAVAEGTARVLGVIELSDVVKPGIADGSPSCGRWASAPS